MIDNFKIITLCGSTKFKEQFMLVQKQLTLQGNIVISVGCFGHSGDSISEQQKIMLDEIHKRKIDMSDGIFVINVDGYIGSSTKSEIEYAAEHGKTIDYLVPISCNADVSYVVDSIINEILYDVNVFDKFEINAMIERCNISTSELKQLVTNKIKSISNNLSNEMLIAIHYMCDAKQF